MNNKINPDNFTWCDRCECVTYDYECECSGAWCNGGGCDKCKEIRDILEIMYKNHEFPSDEVAKENNIKKYGSIKTPETKLIEKIFNNKL